MRLLLSELFNSTAGSMHEDFTGSGDNNALTTTLIFDNTYILYAPHCSLKAKFNSFAPFRVGGALHNSYELECFRLDRCYAVESHPI